MSVVVLTGASSGIGRAAAIELGRAGHEVAVVGRHSDRTEEAARAAGGIPFVADFDRIDEVERLADRLLSRFERIDVLANNAGGISRGRRRRTADGVETTWQYNVLAPFVLTRELTPRLQESRGRVIWTTSLALWGARIFPGNPNRDGLPWFDGWPAYSAAKRADAMLALETARRTGLESYSFHPGLVFTRFAGVQDSPLAPLLSRVTISPEQGAAPLVMLASGDDLGVPNGSYFVESRPSTRLPVQVRDPGERAKLWDALTVQSRAIP